MNKIENEKADIKKRNQIMSSIYGKEKISTEERYWLNTHSIYNAKKGYPFLQLSIEKIEPHTWYDLKVSVDKCSNDMVFYPLIGTPDNEGQIITNDDVCGYNGEPSSSVIKLLSLNSLVEKGNYTDLEIYSSDGIFSVQYIAECTNPYLSQAKMRKTSTAHLGFAMIRKEISHNKIRFACKNPETDIEISDFNDYIFTVEWEKIRL